ncbi:MAG: serine--glyoxylate aminotransferase [Rhodospirillaceae bacterium]|nr:serine--glyoxylate aminotransferase [Rhodospirillaceae bacterium]
MSHRSGRHFLQIPGPSNVPDRILRAIDKATMDHRGPEFGVMARQLLDDLKEVFKTDNDVIIFPSSGTGAWEAALVNTLSFGDKVVMYESGQFAALWKGLAERIGLEPQFIESDWRHPVNPTDVEALLKDDSTGEIKAVCMVHNETSTGIVNDIAAVRKAIDSAGHSALLMVDTISGLGSIDYRHDEWGVDVSVAGSQKGLMMPPGLSFNAVSDKAKKVSELSTMPKSYWSWDEMLKLNATGYFPYTPATNLLYGLSEAIAMLQEEGLDNVFIRHSRFAEATRRAVRAWGLEIVCKEESARSDVITAVFLPDGYDADAYRKIVLENFDMSLGNGLGKVAGKVFRIGHLGDFNELMLAGTLCGVEMGLGLAGVPHNKNGVSAALDYLAHGGNAAPA